MTMGKGSKSDHCGPMNSRSEMMKAWDSPKGNGGTVKEAGREAAIGGMKSEAGGHGDKGEMK